MRENLHYNGKERMERYRNTIVYSEEITPENKKIILQFYDLCKAQGLSNARLCKTLWMTRNLGIWIGKKKLEEATKIDVIDLVNLIQEKYTKHNTIMDYKAMIKKFYKHTMGEGSRYPESVSWIKLNGNKEKKDPSSILVEDEILRMIQAQNILDEKWSKPRNKALIAFMYDSGVRVGELLSIRIGDIKVNGDLWNITVRGKTGQRTFPIFPSIPYLKDYITIHPRAHDRDAFLLCSFNYHNQSISYHKVASILRDTRKRSGINKPCNPHAFRHSAVTRDAVFMSDQQLKRKFGWTSSSRQLSTYSHIRLEDLENSYRLYYSLGETKSEESKMMLKLCPFCHAENKPENKFCQSCKKLLDIQEIQKTHERNEALQDFMIEFLTALAEENPKIKSKFAELVKKKKMEGLFG